MDDRYTVRPDGCWEWNGARQPKGYGIVWHEGAAKLAHRVLYERRVGPIPEGCELHHMCGHPCCVNPAHMEPLSRAEHCRREPRGGQGKLSAEQARAIKTDKRPSRLVGATYGVSHNLVLRIRRGEAWAGV